LKKLLFLLLLFLSTLLYSGDKLDAFIDQQIKIEKQLIDDNITIEEKVKLKNAQSRDFQEFILQYATESDDNLKQVNPYRTKIYKLKLRYNSNKHRGYTIAALRDKLLLHNYKMRNRIRSTLNDVIRLTESKSKEFYEEKVNELILKQFSDYKPVNRQQYLAKKIDKTSPLYIELEKALNNAVYLDNFINTFASELIANKMHIYRAVKIANSKLFSLINQINKSAFGQKANIYLEKYTSICHRY